MIETMKQLIEELNRASDAYYNGGNPIMSDVEWDVKLEELMMLEEKTGTILSNSPSQKVGAPVLSSLLKVGIDIVPMLSLPKVHSLEEVQSFIYDKPMLAMVKCDGLSIRLIYQNYKLIGAHTRGNGYEGTDIFEHVKHFLNVPLVIDKWGSYIVDGEAVILDKDFELINANGQFKNQRNAAAGALNLLSMEEVKARRLSFIAWDVIKGAKSILLNEQLREAENLGFDTVPWDYLYFIKEDKAEIEIEHKAVITAAEIRGIPMDGVVWKYNDQLTGRSLGKTAHHFNNAIAWKPENEVVETELINIDWTMGRTGVLTPVAVFKPVELLGSTIERASLHNVSIMDETLGTHPYIGQHIKVTKANLIIPQVIWANKDYPDSIYMAPLNVPTKCPICGGTTYTEGDIDTPTILKCGNPQCQGKLVNRLDHFCGRKGLDIKHISKATLEKLIEWGWVTKIHHLYDLRTHVNEWMEKPGFGQKSVMRIIDSIEKSRECDLDKFIAALGIPLVGTTVAKQLAELCGDYPIFKECISTNYAWSQHYDFGPAMEEAINSFDYNEANYLVDWELIVHPYTKEETENVSTLANEFVVITGKLSLFKNRQELTKKIKSYGGNVQGSINSKTTYLICNDKNSTTAKMRDAQARGVTILTEQEFTEKFFD